MFFSEVINNYWNQPQIIANILMGLNFLGAILLGMVLGVERTMRGRAAGLRTYGLVAGASCAIMIIAGYPEYWYGGSAPEYFYPDPGRVIQGIVTGVGFLGAGVIMKDGFSITGLSTAASIWLCSAIGILVGVGFYGAAISVTFMSLLMLTAISKFEKYVPQQISYSVHIVFKEGVAPNEKQFRETSLERGFVIPINGINIACKDSKIMWKYTAYSVPNKQQANLTEISNDLLENMEIESFEVSKTRM